VSGRCHHCGTRTGDDPFIYRGFEFCCECMSALCSWFLDGGMSEAPEMFAYLTDRAEATP
jgi:hypothetical protein